MEYLSMCKAVVCLFSVPVSFVCINSGIIYAMFIKENRPFSNRTYANIFYRYN
jgi:hypothetical protein